MKYLRPYSALYSYLLKFDYDKVFSTIKKELS